MRCGIDWECRGGWVQHGGEHPHIKAAMNTAIDIHDADELLRSELLVILGIMIERMKDESLKNHIVIPVT